MFIKHLLLSYYRAGDQKIPFKVLENLFAHQWFLMSVGGTLCPFCRKGTLGARGIRWALGVRWEEGFLVFVLFFLTLQTKQLVEPNTAAFKACPIEGQVINLPCCHCSLSIGTLRAGRAQRRCCVQHPGGGAWGADRRAYAQFLVPVWHRGLKEGTGHLPTVLHLSAEKLCNVFTHSAYLF